MNDAGLPVARHRNLVSAIVLSTTALVRPGIGAAQSAPAAAPEAPANAPPPLYNLNRQATPKTAPVDLLEQRAPVMNEKGGLAARASSKKPTGARVPQPPAGNAVAARNPPPPAWRELWRVHVGNVRGVNQIAVRGPLVVVASAGERPGPDPLDGIYVIDGRAAAPSRIVRHINTEDDALGVALVADDLFFFSRTLHKARLDGWPLASPPGDGKESWVGADDSKPAQPHPVVAEGLIAPGTQSWIRTWDRLPARPPEVQDNQGRVRSWPVQGQPVSAPSIGNVDGDDTWDVVFVAGQDLYAFSTGSSGTVGREFPLGDVAASGRKPAFEDDLKAYASRLPPRDATRWLVPDAAPTDRAFEETPANELSALSSTPQSLFSATATHLKLNIDGRSTETEDAAFCGDRTFGINEGRLIRLDGRTWRLVKGAPFPVARLACHPGTGAALIKMSNGVAYRLPAPVRWQPMAMVVAIVIPLGLLLVALYTRAQRVAAGQDHDRDDVRRRFIADAPRAALAAAHDKQRDLVLGLLKFLDNDDTRPPVTIGLYGKWGSGKSSIMKMLREQLCGTGRYIDVWFNAWRFHREEQLAPALLQSIVEEIGRQSDWVTRLAALADRIRTATVRDVLLAGSLAGAALLSFLLFLHFDNAIGWLSSILALGVGLWQKVLNPLLKVFSLEPAKLLDAADSRKRIGFIREFGDQFRRVLRRLPKHARLIVFVDDLDRCQPDRIVDLLETLNMLADTGCGFFVVATDRDTVRRAVELVHRNVIELMRAENPEEARHYGDRYLDKIVTVGVNVPQVRPEQMTFQDPAPEPPALRQLGKAIAQALKPRAAWLFAAAFALAIGVPLWAAVRYVGDVSAVLDSVGALVQGNVPGMAKSASPATPGEHPPVAAKTTTTLAETPTPAVPAPDVSKSARTVASEMLDWIGLDRAPSVPPQPAPPIVTQVMFRGPADESGLSLVLLRLVEGLAGLAALMFLGLFWAQNEQRRRTQRAQPMGHDSPAFTQSLNNWIAKLPSNPRTTIRFNNAARFLYHVVATARPGDLGWEGSFFQILYQRWMDLPEPPAIKPDWLGKEMRVWLPSAPSVDHAEAAE